MIGRRSLLVSACVLGIGLVGSARAAVPFRIRGTIDSMHGQTLRLTARSGGTDTVTLAPDISVTEIVPARIGDIKPGSYIGTAAVAQPDGSLKALEVQVFPPSMRGVGEGHRPWDFGPQSSMTNGTVGQVSGTAGRMLTLRYKGGEQHVVVPAGVPIITYERGTRALLAPGAHVIVFAVRDAAGVVVAQRIGVGKGGLIPPM